MAQTQVIDFIEENQYRLYPFTSDSSLMYAINGNFLTQALMPNNAILDCNIYVNNKFTNVLALNFIRRSGFAFTITFDSVSFVIPDASAIVFPYYTPRAGNGSYVVLGEGILTLAQGVSGFSAARVLPSLIIEMSHAWKGVNEITTHPNYLSETTHHRALLPLQESLVPIIATGDVTVYSGYNFEVYIQNQKLNLAALKGYGIPLDCSTSFLSPEFLDCGEIVSYINGVPPNKQGVFRFVAGENINIFDSPETEGVFKDTIDLDAGNNVNANSHTFFVGLTFGKTDICAPITPAIPN